MGFFMAHAVWCVSDGETLVPFAGAEDADGNRRLTRFVAERIEESVARGKEWLQSGSKGAAAAVTIFDGYITLDDGRTDALLAEVRDYSNDGAHATWAAPYRPAGSAGGFTVGRPALIDFGPGSPDGPRLAEALWRGVAAHKEGAAVWSKHMEQSH